MRIVVVLFIIAFSSCQVFKENKHGIVIKKQGILFLSWNNPYYIDTLKFKDDLNILFLRDIFLPLKSFDSSKDLKANFIYGTKRKGIELGNIDERSFLDSVALKLSNDSILTPCYKEKGFSIVPVVLTYRKISNFPNIENCGNKVNLWIGNKEVQFEYTTNSIEFIKIEVFSNYLH